MFFRSGAWTRLASDVNQVELIPGGGFRFYCRTCKSFLNGESWGEHIQTKSHQLSFEIVRPRKPSLKERVNSATSWVRYRYVTYKQDLADKLERRARERVEGQAERARRKEERQQVYLEWCERQEQKRITREKRNVEECGYKPGYSCGSYMSCSSLTTLAILNTMVVGACPAPICVGCC